MSRFIVIGLGNFGSNVAAALYEAGHDVAALDLREEVVDEIAPRVSRSAVGDGTSAAVLERIGAKDADVAIVSTGDDIAASVLTVLALRDLDVNQVVVKVVSHDHARAMDRLGADETVFPERDTALRLAKRIASTKILNYIDLGGGASIQEMAVPPEWTGKTLRQLQLPRRFKVSVVAVHDALRDEMVIIPEPDARLKESDSLLLVARNEDLDRLR